MPNITVFYHVNSSSAPFSDIRTAKSFQELYSLIICHCA